MIIPVKCFTCGKVLADKYRIYLLVTKMERGAEERSYYVEGAKKSVEGEVLDRLGLTKQCCRRHMLTHVDIE